MSYKKETIGSQVEIVGSKNLSLVGMKGKIMKETKNTMWIKTKIGMKMVLKSGTSFSINGNIVAGNSLTGKPEDRVK